MTQKQKILQTIGSNKLTVKDICTKLQMKYLCYAILDDLVNEGYVNSTWSLHREPKGHNRVRYYTLTQLGQMYLFDLSRS